jgi:hypothetical protein
MYAIELSFKDLIMSFLGKLIKGVGRLISAVFGGGGDSPAPDNRERDAAIKKAKDEERRKRRYRRGQEQTDGAGTDGISDVLGG